MSDFPIEPGYRPNATGGTSQAAASLRGHATMLDLARDELANGPATCEELAERLERRLAKSVLLNSVRARVCQLHKRGGAFDTGERGLGESNRTRVVRWALTAHEKALALRLREGVR